MKPLLPIMAAVAVASLPIEAQPITFTRFDESHSTIAFTVPILGGLSEVQGRFRGFAATLVYDPDDPTRSTIEVTIDAASIDTGIEERDVHLRSPDFFDVANYPRIVFRSSATEQRDGRLVVRGSLTMRGVSKPIEIPCAIAGIDVDSGAGVSIGVSADVTVDRDEFGISWRHEVPTFVGDEIAVRIRLLSRPTARPAELPPP